MTTEQILKYPRTRHVEGSRLQPGDHDLEAVPLSVLRGRHLVIEEKLDGANAGISFADDGTLRLQSRGHLLEGGGRERHFDLFKTWAARHRDALWRVLGPRRVLYGEWVYAKHTIYYDALPHYFLEFDVFDRDTGEFLSTARRRELLADSPVVSVPVVYEGGIKSLARLHALVGPSLYKSTGWRADMIRTVEAAGLDVDRAVLETDPSDEAEGLYIKDEADGQVVARYKFVRPTFLTVVLDSGSHWLDRPIVPNRLAEGVDLFAEPEAGA